VKIRMLKRRKTRSAEREVKRQESEAWIRDSRDIQSFMPLRARCWDSLLLGEVREAGDITDHQGTAGVY
jgi:hypothetical protein